jgi:hypothetical protein
MRETEVLPVLRITLSDATREARADRYRSRPLRGLFVRGERVSDAFDVDHDASESSKRSMSFTLHPSLDVSGYMENSLGKQCPKYTRCNPTREARADRYRSRPLRGLFVRGARGSEAVDVDHDASESSKRLMTLTLRPSLDVSG